MEVTGRRKSLGLCILLGIHLTQVSQGVHRLVCPKIGYLDSPVNLTCIGNGSTHSYKQPAGGVVTTCSLTTAKCLPDVMVIIPNSSYSVLTLPRVNQSHAGNWTCSIGENVSGCVMTVAKLPSCIILSKRTAEEVTIRVQVYHCPDSIELYMDTGNLTRRLLNTSSTTNTGGMLEITVNETTSFEQTKKLVYFCGDKSSEIACEDRTPPIQKVQDNYIVIGVVVPFLFVTVIVVAIIIIIHKRKKKDQKDQNPDPQQHLTNLYYADACVKYFPEPRPKKDNSPSCGAAFVDIEHYAIVDDLSVPETKTMKQVLHLEMDAGGYSLVADRRAADKGTKGDDTATSQDTGYSETVEGQRAAAPSIMQEDLPLQIDDAGYSTVTDRQAAETSPQREDTAKPLDTGYYETVEGQSAAAPCVMQGDLPLQINAAGYSTVADRQAAETSSQREVAAKPLETECDESVEEESAAEPSIRQGDIYATINKKKVTHLPIA
ncbi:uncharacterized protein [Haliotis cracherodii]|uniref:uncharacterized protein n=1 Tax=Haliotis cracherodii TaxID=6455 RepID=UPI0039ED943F